MFAKLQQWLGLKRPPPSIPDALWRRVEAALPFLDFLGADERLRLRDLARGFLAEKEFHGAQGLRLTDEMLLGIALQACLPILNKGLDAYRSWVGVIVYPGDFVIPRHEMDEDGVVHEYDDEVLGEAWEGGPVVLSWFPGHLAPDGVNVVIHEFAHKLDMENGGADGFPRLPAGMSREAWAGVFSSAYEAFCDDVDAGRDTVLDPYAAESPGEFFAVASEAFFETPAILSEDHPDVYAQLAAFYGSDPAAGERRLDEMARVRKAAPPQA
ncbi:MAG: zinc-dependent peptidase [Proteobacteria bacterium]|nr:zinc-dependent peptidase [Pseudomonadota bacterium]